jgi:hypothetical protein
MTLATRRVASGDERTRYGACACDRGPEASVYRLEGHVLDRNALELADHPRYARRHERLPVAAFAQRRTNVRP